MENKYYTPEMNEFHPNFEFEYATSNGWKKCILGKNDIEHPELRGYKDDLMKIAHANCRVKFLDREDIESLGWDAGSFVNIWSENDDIIDGFSAPVNNTDTYILFYDPESQVVGIYLQRIYNELTGNWQYYIMFSGRIKNKSELFRIMQMLDINP